MSIDRRVRYLRLVAATLLLAAAGCADGGGAADAGVDGGPGADQPDETAVMFEPDRVLQIEIELDPTDWDTIREQSRSIMDILGNCGEGPFSRPFAYVPADVTVDGEVYANVGLRKKGFLGSLDDERPSLKVRANEYEPGQLIHGLERLTLNNNLQDPSHVRQCVGYDLFRAAGVPSPRCSFAHVTVNGVDLGVYSHVESVKKRFLRRHFTNDEGNLYEGTLSDFRDGWTATFERQTNTDDPIGPDIAALTEALTVPDAELVAAVSPLVDLDAFYTYWALEVILGHWDSYSNNTNNFFVYHNPASDRFRFIPWGIDQVFVEPEKEEEEEEEATLSSVFANGHLARRLYLLPETRDRYVERLTELLDTVWDEDELLAEVDRISELIAPHTLEDTGEAVDEVVSFIEEQRQVILAELAGGPPAWDAPPMEEYCLQEVGEIAVTFSTTWGTLDEEDPFSTGTGTMTGDIGDWPIEPEAVGAMSGLEIEDGEESAVVAILGHLADDTMLLVYVGMPPDELGPGSFAIDLESLFVALIAFDPVSGDEDGFWMVADGDLTLSEASTEEGAPVVGSVSGSLIEWF